MCIAVYKPMGVDFPCKRVLKRCFYSNPDGAGFMVANGETVEIHKGYMGFRSFWKALRSARALYGDDKAYVMHFRISTQGGVRRDGCHPFPLSKDMDDMRRLDTEADIGVAHNGIIDLCSDYSWGYTSSYYSGYRGGYYNRYKELDYSDTMKFITEYLSLIIKDRSYYTDPDTLQLIGKLAGSRLAILDGSGHCELIGTGWETSEGVWYSNSTYKEKESAISTTTHSYPITKTTDVEYETDKNDKFKWDGYYDDEDGIYDADGFLVGYKNPYDPYADYYGADGFYDFSQTDCPATIDGDESYCIECRQWCQCWQYGEREDDDDYLTPEQVDELKTAYALVAAETAKVS